MTEDRPPEVTVVVAVYNSGTYVDPLLASLERQTLPADRFEVLFVDDGSTDGTGQRLDRLAEQRANVRVVHEPNSGACGRPRNVGIERARGRYVLFCDDDDWLGDEALERLVAMAHRAGTDIVLPKTVGVGRTDVPRELFRRSIERTTLAESNVIYSLKAHKLFRTEFLRAHGLRFVEHRHPAEDRLFLLEAYLRAEGISVLADYDCYYLVHHEDRDHLSLQPEPLEYCDAVRDVLRKLADLTEPGPVRNRLLRRFLRVDLLGQLEGKQLLRLSRDRQRELVVQTARVIEEYVPPSVDASLFGIPRLLAHLARAADTEALGRLALATADWPPQTRLTSVSWADGSGQVRWQLPLAPQSHGHAPTAPPTLLVRLRDGAQEQELPSQVERVEQNELAVVSRLDLDRLPLGNGIWDVYARVPLLEWQIVQRFGADREAEALRPIRPILFGVPIRAATVYPTAVYGNLSIRVGSAAHIPPPSRAVTARVWRHRTVLRLTSPVWSSRRHRARVRIEAVGGDAGVQRSALLSPCGGDTRLRAAVRLPRHARPGTRWRVVLNLPPEELPLAVIRTRELRPLWALRARARRVLRRPGGGD